MRVLAVIVALAVVGLANAQGCTPFPCWNNATCVDGGNAGNYTCDCVSTYFTGKMCQLDMDGTLMVSEVPFTALLTTGTDLALGDTGTTDVDIGFWVYWFGRAYNTLTISADGWVQLGSTRKIVAVTGDLNQVPGTGTIRYRTTGTPGNMVFSATWENVVYYSTSISLSFQIAIYQMNATVVVSYADATFRTYSDAPNLINGGGSSVATWFAEAYTGDGGFVQNRAWKLTPQELMGTMWSGFSYGIQSVAYPSTWSLASLAPQMELTMGDETTQAVYSPFPVYIDGMPQYKVSINSNGYLYWGASSSMMSFSLFGSADLNPGRPGAEVFTGMMGTAPNRGFYVVYRNVPYYSGAPTNNTFGMVFWETSGAIDTLYESADFSGSSAWPGYVNSTGMDDGYWLNGLPVETRVTWRAFHLTPMRTAMPPAPLTMMDGVSYSIATPAWAPYAQVWNPSMSTTVTLTDSDSTTVYLPFALGVDGQAFATITISSDGYVYFGSSSRYSFSALGSADLYPPAAGAQVYYGTYGTAPNRVFYVTYDMVPYYSYRMEGNSFAFLFHETSNMVEVQYKWARVLVPSGSSATTGYFMNATQWAEVQWLNGAAAGFPIEMMTYTLTPHVMTAPWLTTMDGVSYSVMSSAWMPNPMVWDPTMSTVLTLSDDGSTQVYLPFVLGVDGQAFATMTISANGYVYFGASSSRYSFSGLGTADLYPPLAGAMVYYGWWGTAPNRVFYVTYDMVPYYSYRQILNSFAFLFHETSDVVEVQYKWARVVSPSSNTGYFMNATQWSEAQWLNNAPAYGPVENKTYILTPHVPTAPYLVGESGFSFSVEEMNYTENAMLWDHTMLNSTMLTLTDDGSAFANLPFVFFADGKAYTSCTVYANGYVQFGTSGTARFAALDGADLYPPAPGAEVYIADWGMSPMRAFVVVYKDVPYFSQRTMNNTFAFLFWESGHVDILYDNGRITNVNYVGVYTNSSSSDDAMWLANAPLYAAYDHKAYRLSPLFADMQPWSSTSTHLSAFFGSYACGSTAFTAFTPAASSTTTDIELYRGDVHLLFPKWPINFYGKLHYIIAVHAQGYIIFHGTNYNASNTVPSIIAINSDHNPQAGAATVRYGYQSVAPAGSTVPVNYQFIQFIGVPLASDASKTNTFSIIFNMETDDIETNYISAQPVPATKTAGRPGVIGLNGQYSCSYNGEGQTVLTNKAYKIYWVPYDNADGAAGLKGGAVAGIIIAIIFVGAIGAGFVWFRNGKKWPDYCPCASKTGTSV